jgi:hypothetical protein
MATSTENPATAFQDAARDCVGLVTLLHRAIADRVARDRHTANGADVNDLFRLREALVQALVPTRDYCDETEAEGEINVLIAEVRPHRV